MSKIDFSKKTKLEMSNNEGHKKLSLISRQEDKYKNKSFRFKAIYLQRIKKILEKANEVSDYTVFKETDIIRGLLAMGEELSGEKMISYIRKSI